MHGYFQDSKGNKSSTRLTSFIVAMVAIALSSWLVIIKNDVAGAAAIMASFGTFIITFKTLGKHLENKENQIE